MKSQRVPWPAFLRDVFVCSLGAYGGPEAHMGVFMDQLVVRRKYLDEDELVELLALCSILPGPTSTQTIVAVGHKIGGPLLGLLTMLVWALPVVTLMIALSFLSQALDAWHVPQGVLRFVGPMAVGFILVAAWRIGRKVVKDRMTAALMLTAAVLTYFVRTPWVFPAVLLAGGAVSVACERKPDVWHRPRLTPPWGYLVAFGVLAAGLLAASHASPLADLCERFYRYGYLVFGGGQVVVPLMHGELVEEHKFLTNAEFLTGYGLVQGLPGPMFSFAAYAGGMAARGGGTLHQVMGGMAGGIGIFLPGILLIYFVIPVWEQLKQVPAIRLALKGIHAVAGGLIAVAAVILMQASGVQPANLVATLLTVLLLATRAVPAPLVVVGALAAGVAMAA